MCHDWLGRVWGVSGHEYFGSWVGFRELFASGHNSWGNLSGFRGVLCVSGGEGCFGIERDRQCNKQTLGAEGAWPLHLLHMMAGRGAGFSRGLLFRTTCFRGGPTFQRQSWDGMIQ